MRLSQSTLGWYHIISAIAGVAMSVWIFASGGLLVGQSILVATAPFALCLVAGVRLLQGHRHATMTAYLAQAIQIPIVILPAVTWKFVGGAIASMVLTIEGTQFYGGVEATWLFGLGTQGALPAALGINIAPVLVITALARGSIGRRKVGQSESLTSY